MIELLFAVSLGLTVQEFKVGAISCAAVEHENHLLVLCEKPEEISPFLMPESEEFVPLAPASDKVCLSVQCGEGTGRCECQQWALRKKEE